MGYRSNGYFIIPAQYSAELERRVADYLVAEKARRVRDRAQADMEGKHYIYASNDPWNPLSGFEDSFTLMEDTAGLQYHKYEIDGWKWYQGSGFPGIVEKLLYEIDEDSQLAVFVLQGEDWDDTTVFDSTGKIDMRVELEGNPWTGKTPQIFATINHEGNADNADNYQELLNQLNALEPTQKSEVMRYYERPNINSSTIMYTPEYNGMAINAPTRKQIWTDRSEMSFYWDTGDNDLYAKIIRILDAFEEHPYFGEDFVGFAVRMTDDYEDHTINGTDVWEYEVYPISVVDDTDLVGFELREISDLNLKDVFPDMFGP